MIIGTGTTVYEQILSVSEDNYPVTGATFDVSLYNNGFFDSGTTVNIVLSDESRGVYTAIWSASTIGNYQLYAKNNLTSVIFISDLVIVKTDEEISTNVYIGL